MGFRIGQKPLPIAQVYRLADSQAACLALFELLTDGSGPTRRHGNRPLSTSSSSPRTEQFRVLTIGHVSYLLSMAAMRAEITVVGPPARRTATKATELYCWQEFEWGRGCSRHPRRTGFVSTDEHGHHLQNEAVREEIFTLRLRDSPVKNENGTAGPPSGVRTATADEKS